MALFTPNEREVARAIGSLAFSNPFLPVRIELEQKALGNEFVPLKPTWSADLQSQGDNENVEKISILAAKLSEKARSSLIKGDRPSEDDARIYEELVLYTIYYRFEDAMYQDIVKPGTSRNKAPKVTYFNDLKKDVHHFFEVPSIETEERHNANNLHALLFQYRRAFHFIFRKILGSSMPTSRLRASVWESVFTSDMRRYWRSFIGSMHDMGTLITGPSGTGKELVASAIGLSRYIPFDSSSLQFKEDFRNTFHPLNLSALSKNLIESELFGHKKGAFTGATSDRDGYLERKGECHTVFLDEIGDVNVDIQLKLLRVLQTREFHALGDSVKRHFGGKIVAATNRDLFTAIEEGDFRADLYYRLCSDHIVTPSLRDQVADDPEEFSNLVASITSHVVGEQECETITKEVMDWINTSLRPDYQWPGNIRELEQCIRSVVVHGVYKPLGATGNQGIKSLAENIAAGGLSADELMKKYCTLVYAKTGRYQEVARRLGLDRRTVKAKIDEKLLEELLKTNSQIQIANIEPL